ncbi:MAG: T9SS type A sorting domain-containing protein [Bacteroidia bacterium]|nr:T9SS type A sorting domain-containing protein [Bacteroidia bacterium]
MLGQKWTLFWMIAMICFQGFSQQGQKLYLASATYTPQVKPFKEVLERTPLVEGKRYVLMQSVSIPDELTRNEMKKSGIEFLFYLPDYSWYISMSDKVSEETLTQFEGMMISEILPEYKLSAALSQNQIPPYAYSEEGYLRIEADIFPGLDFVWAENALSEKGARILSKSGRKNQIVLEILPDKWKEIAALPYIAFISLPAPPQTNELTYRNTVGRANYLSSGINGMNYDGTGVVLAIEEGGIVDTLSIDFQGRLDEQTTGNSVSGHKTGCSMNAGGAGNYNPKYRSNAFGASIMSLNDDTWTVYDTADVRMASHSYGWGVSGGYWASARDHDQQMRLQPQMMHFYSSGNVGGDTCNYGTYNGISGWANITGGAKQAKNLMAICNTTPYDSLSFGSVGPAFDGRIKPDLCIEGIEGTSYSSPKAAGMMAQLYQVWKNNHNGNTPPSALIKGFMLNTADDMYNPGPDFKTGFGRINVRRAYNSIMASQYWEDSVSNNGARQFTLSVPANVKEVRTLLYWHDYEAVTNAAKALVNNLNLSMMTPGGTTFNPWVLNIAPHPDSLDNPAYRGVDSLNNTEQITLANPAAGNYILTVNGALVPQGPQKFYLVYEFLYDEITLTYPIGREHFVAGEEEIVRWDNYGNNNSISLEYSTDNGSSWQPIVSGLQPASNNYKWTVPYAQTGRAKVRVISGTKQSISPEAFSIMEVPENVGRIWSCGDSLMLDWDPVPNATGYRITHLGQKYMDSIAFSVSSHAKIRNANTVEGEWFGVQAYGPDNALSRRTIAWKWVPGDTGCVAVNAGLIQVSPYENGYFPDCFASVNRPLKAKIQNVGINDLTGFPLYYQIDNGIIHQTTFSGILSSADEEWITFSDSILFSVAGTYNLKVWVAAPGDAFLNNDTMQVMVIIYPSQSVLMNYTQNFDGFTNCATSWGCSEVDCNLSSGWYNLMNTPEMFGDSIDWRTLSGATGTGSTGPDFDHTTGSGKYVYLETSSTDGSGCRFKTADLQSVCFDMRGSNQPELDFWYHAYGGTIGTLNVEVLGNDGWQASPLTEISGDQGNQWLNKVVNLSNWEEEQIVIRFRGTTGNGYTGDLALDDISVSTLPNPAFSSLNAICLNDTLTVQNLSSYAQTYSWYISPASGVSFLNGTSTTSQNPEFGFSSSGNFVLSLIATNGNGADTLSQSITVFAQPSSGMITITDSVLCQGESVQMTANAAGSAPFSYQWLVNNTPTGNTTPSFNINNAGVTQSGVYACNITNSCGTLTTDIPVVVNPLPVVFIGNDTTVNLNSSISLNTGGGFSSYLWNNGWTQASLTVNTAQTGLGAHLFYVTVTDVNGCQDTDSIWITVQNAVSLEEITDKTGFGIYPNPNQGEMLFLFSSEAAENAEYTIRDIQSKVIQSGVLETAPGENRIMVRIPAVSKGIYLVSLRTGEKKYELKLMIE